jgi:TonB-dependent receptor
MLDMPLAEPNLSWLEKVRLIGGVRYETTEMTVNSQSYQANSLTGQRTNTSVINQTDWLPAVGLILSLRSNMNLRLHYSETVARPSFRELAAYRSYDPVLDETLEGNPNLTMSSSQNFDIRWEWFFAPGELISAGVFYKKLTGPIERFFVTLDQDIVSYLNRDNGTVFGLEFEGRKSLGFIDHVLGNFTVGGNVSLITSETELTDNEFDNKLNYVPDASRTRQLYDQSPYIINLDLSYDNPNTGTSASLLYNVAGPRITIASLTTEDVFEQPAPALDFVVAQKIGRHLTVRFSARNLLDPIVERTYGEDSDLIYSSYKRGRTYGISLSYEF